MKRPLGKVARRRFIRPRTSTVARRRGGFTLLEVILAFAILAGSTAVLGELARMGVRHASEAQYLAQAQLLCESKMAEIICSGEQLQGVQGEPLEAAAPSQPAWLCSVETATVDEDGLIAVSVTMIQDLPPEARPVKFGLTRWILDPSLQGTAANESATEEESESSSDDTAGGTDG